MPQYNIGFENKQVENIKKYRQEKNQHLTNIVTAKSIDELLRKEVLKYKQKGFSQLRITEYIFQNSLKNLYYYESNKEHPTKRIRFHKEHILNTISVMDHEIAFQNLEEIKKKIQYKGSSYQNSLAIFTKFILPALNHDSQNHPEIIAKVIMHFIWQVKRKMNALKVQNHLCPIFINVHQGVGKTEFVKNLCKPFSQFDSFFLNKSVGEIVDSREIASNLERNILFLDELAQAEKSDISFLKNIITTETLSPRILGSNKTIHVENKSTFIATANVLNLAEKIKDDTGNRRFFPIEVKSFKEISVPYYVLENLNYLTENEKRDGYLYPLNFDGTWLWTLVDENWKCFLSLEEIAAIQKKHTVLTDVDEFIEIFNVTIDKNSTAILISDLFYVFKKLFPKSKFDQIKSFSNEMTKRFNEAKVNNAGQRKKHTGFHLSINETFNGYLYKHI